jgi:hypothetical protein
MKGVNEPGNTKTSVRGRRAILLLLLILPGVLLFAALYDTFWGRDIWWHLAGGRAILQMRAVPATDPFSYTAAGREWIDLHWLFQVLAYGLYRLAGVPALKILEFLAIAGTLFFMGKSCRPGTDPVLVTGSLLLAVLVSRFCFSVRPVILSMLFLSITLFVLEKGVHRIHPGPGGRRLLLFLPFLQLLWVNVHSLYVLGLAVQAFFLVESLLRKALASREGSATAGPAGLQALVLAASAGVTFVNPYGAGAFRLPLEVFTRISGAYPVYGAIGEFVSPFRLDPRFSFVFYFYVFSALLAVSLVWNARKAGPAHFLISVSFFYLAARANRNLFPFAVLTAPILASNVQDILDSAFFRRVRAGPRLPVRVPFVRYGFALFLVFFAGFQTFLLGANRIYEEEGSFRKFADFDLSLRYPVGAADFLEKSGIKGRLFHGIDEGGYLLWKFPAGRRVFIDGRLEVYDPEQFRQFLRILAAPDRYFPEALAKYDFRVIVLRPYGNVYSKMLRYLAARKEWKAVYAAHDGLVFTRDPNNLPAKLPPEDPSGSEASDEAREKEVWGSVKASPWKRRDLPLRALQTGQVFLQTGRPRRAEEAFLEGGRQCPLCVAPLRGYLLARGETLLAGQKYAEALRDFDALRSAGEDPLLWLSGEARAHLGLGALQDARNDLVRASGIDTMSLSLNKLLGVLEWRKGEWKEAKWYFDRAAELAPRDPESLLYRAIVAAEAGEETDPLFLSYLDSLPGGDQRESRRYLLRAPTPYVYAAALRSLYLLRASEAGTENPQKERWFGRNDTFMVFLVWGTVGRERTIDIAGYGPGGSRFDFGNLQVTPDSLSSWAKIDLSRLGGEVEGFWRMEIKINGRTQKNLWFRVGGMGAWLERQY